VTQDTQPVDIVHRKIALQLADELKARPSQVQAAVALLDGGATVPFIARYRKEATEGLDDIQLRELETRLAYLRELEERRAAVLRRASSRPSWPPRWTPPPPSRCWKTCTRRSSRAVAPRE
jgi:protein Tex